MWAGIGKTVPGRSTGTWCGCTLTTLPRSSSPSSSPPTSIPFRRPWVRTFRACQSVFVDPIGSEIIGRIRNFGSVAGSCSEIWRELICSGIYNENKKTSSFEARYQYLPTKQTDAMYLLFKDKQIYTRVVFKKSFFKICRIRQNYFGSTTLLPVTFVI